MDVPAEYARWLDLTADLVSRPSAALPHDRLLAELSSSFESLSSWHVQDADGSFSFDLSHPVRGFPSAADLDAWSRVNRSLHPLLYWFKATGDPTPLTVDRVPKELAPAEGFQLVRDLCGPAGIDRQLSIPYDLSPNGGRAFVLAQTGADFSDDHVELARRIQPLIALINRQSVILARAATENHQAGGLTGREQAVVQLLSEGLTAEEIGHALGVSPRTVHTHLAHLYRKLDVSDRLRAVAVAAQLGLLHTCSEPPVDIRPTQVVYSSSTHQVRATT